MEPQYINSCPGVDTNECSKHDIATIAQPSPGHAAQQVPHCRQLAGVYAELEGQHARNKGGQVHREALQHEYTKFSFVSW